MTPAVEKPVGLTPVVFNQRMLRYYDRLLEFTCNRVWHCPIRRTLEHYRRHLSPNHLEVGVGTGYFLEYSHLPGPEPRLALLDLSPHCLERTATRLRRYDPEVYRANALAPIELSVRRFDSIALNYVLHCMPGALREKGIAFANLKPLLNASGVLFGSTVLRHGVRCDLGARAFMRLYNARKIFCNLEDNLADLRQALEATFRNVQIEVIGCVAQFSGRA
ncbi:MAG TPA: class I SAM-dependent methyltransferase [Steroidobacteraceae bacterium]|nr:class I SAM-dependent methyltransferase [Steroidobacteraceae bacterium]